MAITVVIRGSIQNKIETEITKTDSYSVKHSLKMFLLY